ncbi:MAG: YgiT-type zinc finger protein [Dehalococcoidia bacterium]
MRNNQWKETMVERRVRYTIEVEGKLIIIENVPARVCLETGEQFFSPETVEHLQRMVWEQRKPARVVEVPVFEFA